VVSSGISCRNVPHLFVWRNEFVSQLHVPQASDMSSFYGSKGAVGKNMCASPMLTVQVLSQTDTDFRRKFNKEDYEQRRLEKEQEASSSRTLGKRFVTYRLAPRPLIVVARAVPPDQRSNLKARDFKMILDSKLNKTVIVTANAPKSQQAGYYCEVCDVVLRDSNSFLDHMNSKKRTCSYALLCLLKRNADQLKLGMNMKVERATVSQVKDKLESLKRKKTSAETYGIASPPRRKEKKNIFF